MKDLIKRYFMYLIRWQLSTPILAYCLVWCAILGTFWATVVANFIGGLIFFWVDRFIFCHKLKRPLWEIQENIKCVDCGKKCRGYRLVKADNYDRTNDPNPQFRCESCSSIKFLTQENSINGREQ